jgi:hypothetical protein
MNRFLIKTILLASCALLLNSLLVAQDEDRMKQDMEVMQGILSEMLSKGNRFVGRNVEMPRYEKGVGLIFQVPGRAGNLAWAGNVGPGNQMIQVYGSGKSMAYSISPDVEIDPQVEIEIDSEVETQLESAGVGKSKTIQGVIVNAPRADGGQNLPEVLTTFLIQYGDFARQLSDEESLVLVHKAGSDNSILSFSGAAVASASAVASTSNSGFSLKVKMKDLRAFRKGSISESELRARILKADIANAETALEYRVFGRILNERCAEIKGEVTASYLKEEDQEEAPIRYRFPSSDFWGEQVESVPELGVIYPIRFGSPANSTIIFFESRGKSKEKVLEVFEEGEQLDEWAEELVAKMEEAVPRLMLEYGRTLRNLPENQRLIVKLTFPDCHACSAPKELEFSVKSVVLQAYDRQSKSLDAAIKEVRIERRGEAKQ